MAVEADQRRSIKGEFAAFMRTSKQQPRAPDRVYTLREWAQLNALSLRTARRLVAEGNGPRIIQLTSRRVGVRESDAAAWQAARVRGPA
jgi:predicted DNA-binding transcriptional regulator AlpA